MKRWSVAFYFEANWWVLSALALALSLSGKLAPWFLILASALLAVWALLVKRNRIQQGLFWGLAVFWTVQGAQQLLLTQDIFFLIGGILLGLLPIVLSFRSQPFGAWMSILLGSVLCLVGAIGGGELIDYALYLVSLASLVFALNANHLFFLAGETQARLQKLPSRYVRIFSRSLFGGALCAALIFFLFPRTQAWTNPFGFQRHGNEVGYKGTVSLDGTPIVGESSRLAMVVESNNVAWFERVGPTLYFRGSSVDRFDGVRWDSTAERRLPYYPSVEARTTLDHFPSVKRLTIFREPSLAKPVFYPGVLSSLQAPRNLLEGIFYDEHKNLFRGGKGLVRYKYEVHVSMPRPPKEMNLPLAKIRRHAEGKKGLQPFLQIPSRVKESEVFQNWTSEVGLTSKVGVGEALKQIAVFFKNNYRATYLDEYDKKAPFLSFLSSDRFGHCEYFASATALLLRSLGVPTRLVLGYRGGRFNPVSQTIEVQEKNAHAWIEVYFPDRGWNLFDPTPSIPSPPMTGALYELGLYWNAVKYWFNTYIVDYNNQTQKNLASRLKKLPRKGGDFVWEWAPLVAMALLGFAVAGAYVVWRRRKKKEANRLPGPYRQFLKRVAAWGFVRKSGETFGGFHRRLVEAGFPQELMTQLDKLLERQIYAATPPPAAAWERLQASLETLSAPKSRAA